jgi:hypothetical protein
LGVLDILPNEMPKNRMPKNRMPKNRMPKNRMPKPGGKPLHTYHTYHLLTLSLKEKSFQKEVNV